VKEAVAMSRIEAEAREVLLRRRRSLSDDPTPPGILGDPAARWTDYEAAPEPRSEIVRRELAEIEAALLRIQEGRYGTCQSCGGPMGLQRLRAIPEARYCVACSGQAHALE
jgi:DnaK suppressor protein